MFTTRRSRKSAAVCLTRLDSPMSIKEHMTRPAHPEFLQDLAHKGLGTCIAGASERDPLRGNKAQDLSDSRSRASTRHSATVRSLCSPSPLTPSFARLPRVLYVHFGPHKQCAKEKSLRLLRHLHAAPASKLIEVPQR